MTEVLFGFLASYGLPIIALAAYFSCLAVPIPTFAVMLAGGAFAASSDLVLWQVFCTAYVAAILGDQTGFHIGRWAGPPVIAAIERNPKRAVHIARAQSAVAQWGGIGVFFSTWLFAALGPWVNLMAGAARMSWLRFTAWDAAGEAVWVTVYVSLGYLFGSRLGELTDLVSDWSGFITFSAISAGLGVFLLRKVFNRMKSA
ncbi:DedA family protein [Puniceibacterium sediminis]|uniref:Membrane protein DedA, SNARE-associated domain n=1 Tax=Puniceibacterium sediminis TaxID=1608407 RepID=A0A238X4T4_9RHOB|nr:DedA family protein [Puniceibacterium sediminis]SNR53588.1 membrane protein DedA, SNARE-associated domain [Puniceibacterium sediminis]